MPQLVRGMVFLVAFALAGSAAATHGDGDQPYDFAVGSGTASFTNIAFAAKAAPGGGQASGELALDDWRGDVICLIAEGNRGFLIAERIIREGIGARAEYRWLLVEDGGEGAPDLVTFGHPDPRSGIGRQCVFPSISPTEVLAGEAVVHDGDL